MKSILVGIILVSTAVQAQTLAQPKSFGDQRVEMCMKYVDRSDAETASEEIETCIENQMNYISLQSCQSFADQIGDERRSVFQKQYCFYSEERYKSVSSLEECLSLTAFSTGVNDREAVMACKTHFVSQ